MNKIIFLFALFFAATYSFTYNKRWDGGELLLGVEHDLVREDAFSRLQAYNTCSDVTVDTTRKFGEYDSLRFRMERGKWWGENDNRQCNFGTVGTPTARTELPISRNQTKEFLVGFAYRFDPDSDISNPCEFIFFQRHASVRSPSPSLVVKNSTYYVLIVYGSTTGKDQIRSAAIGPAVPRVWTSFVIWYKISGQNDGRVNVWMNDTLVYSFEGQTTYEDVDAPGYAKFGFYMSNLKTGGCISPPELNVWSSNYARFSQAVLQPDIVSSYEHVSPNRRRALTGIDYPPEDSTRDDVSDAVKIGEIAFILMVSLLLVC